MHQPVMLKEVTGSLNLKSGAIVLDATLGGGGHAREILDRILPDGRLIALDSDEAALERAADITKDYGGAFTFVNENFRNVDRVLAKQSIKHIDAAFFDVGVSSYQLDEDIRGFSIRGEGPLDMRMDRRQKVTAHDIVNRLKERELSDIIKELGEERYHKRIARYIVEARNRKPIATTAELAAIIHKAVGFHGRNSRIDPATRTFQAIRIAVNDELAALEEGIKKVISWLAPGARIAVISFHSLEDRIVKNLFKGYAALGVLKVITKKPVRPGPEELAVNARARSGRLRIAERV